MVYDLGFVLDAEIQNGGFEQFLSNSSGEIAQEAKRQLRIIGAESVLVILNRVSAIFPNAVVPTDREERNRVLDDAIARDEAGFKRLMDAATDDYYAHEASLYTALMDFVTANREQFELPRAGGDA